MDNSVNDSSLDQLKSKSLQWAGYGYLIGDAALSTARLMENDKVGAAGGALWATGSLVCAKYANPSAEKQLKLIEQRFAEYLVKQGVDISNNATLTGLAKNAGVREHIESFLYAHPSEILNAVYAIGAGFVLKGGIQKKSMADIACGAIIASGALAGLLIPEKKPDLKNPPKDAAGKVWQWMQEKPLRVSGASYHISNIFALGGAVEQMKKNPSGSSHWFRFLTATSFIFANTALAMSSKNQENGATKHADVVTAQLADISTHIIASQAPAVQEAMVQQISGYLAAQPEINKKSDEIASLLHAKLAVIDKRPRQTWCDRVQQPAAAHSLQ